MLDTESTSGCALCLNAWHYGSQSTPFAQVMRGLGRPGRLVYDLLLSSAKGAIHEFQTSPIEKEIDCGF